MLMFTKLYFSFREHFLWWGLAPKRNVFRTVVKMLLIQPLKRFLANLKYQLKK